MSRVAWVWGVSFAVPVLISILSTLVFDGLYAIATVSVIAGIAGGLWRDRVLGSPQ